MRVPFDLCRPNQLHSKKQIACRLWGLVSWMSLQHVLILFCQTHRRGEVIEINTHWISHLPKQWKVRDKSSQADTNLFAVRALMRSPWVLHWHNRPIWSIKLAESILSYLLCGVCIVDRTTTVEYQHSFLMEDFSKLFCGKSPKASVKSTLWAQ